MPFHIGVPTVQELSCIGIMFLRHRFLRELFQHTLQNEAGVDIDQRLPVDPAFRIVPCADAGKHGKDCIGADTYVLNFEQLVDGALFQNFVEPVLISLAQRHDFSAVLRFEAAKL